MPCLLARQPRRDALDQHPAVVGLPHRIGRLGADEAWFDRVGGCGRSWMVSREKCHPPTSGNDGSIRDECFNLHEFETLDEATTIVEAWPLNDLPTMVILALLSKKQHQPNSPFSWCWSDPAGSEMLSSALQIWRGTPAPIKRIRH
ncbi:hypothetical protein [Burkholderia lata]|uniref:hypothetical protein n=1 Tax=Burkholderia lata (strain ATCC 17760 / DSM 23089 / LMG 22485 / NCIMB 9086 / R18194 / 383) TaxID=482957 RepID=UPI001582D3E7|nr:hypothetical protein [Burkholderia lata]